MNNFPHLAPKTNIIVSLFSIPRYAQKNKLFPLKPGLFEHPLLPFMHVYDLEQQEISGKE